MDPKSHQGGKVPGIDRLAVDRGLAAHGLNPDPVKKGRTQGVRERLVRPGEGTGGLGGSGSSASQSKPLAGLRYRRHRQLGRVQDLDQYMHAGVGSPAE